MSIRLAAKRDIAIINGKVHKVISLKCYPVYTGGMDLYHPISTRVTFIENGQEYSYLMSGNHVHFYQRKSGRLVARFELAIDLLHCTTSQ